MTRPTRCRGARALLATTLLVPLALPGAAAAQQQTSTIEAWGAFSGAIAATDGTLASAYSPPLVFGSEFTSSASQTLAIDTGGGPGWQAGINVFPSRHVGIQLFVDRSALDVSGVNGPYVVALRWTSRQPPDYVPQPFTTSSSTPWPETTGSLHRLTAGLDVVVRSDPRRRLTASVSGGFSYYRLTGTIQPLGYTEFHLGGHSTLFSQDFRLAVSPESNSVGFNAGGDVGIAAGRHAAVVAGIRFFGGPTADAEVRVASITNADQITFSERVEDISKQLAIPRARLGVSGSRIVVGLKVSR